MAEAVITIGTRYADLDAYPAFASDFPDLPIPKLDVAPHAEILTIEYEAQSVDSALVEDGASADTEIALDFGDVAEALAFVIKNNARQDLSVAINGVLAGTEDAGVTSAAGTLSTAVGALAATVAALKAVLATQLAILNAFTGSDSAATIVAAIATANTAIGTANTAVSTAATTSANSALGTALDAGGTAIFTLPHGGVLACALPPGADTPVSALSLYTTDLQVGDGAVEFKVFGST